MNIYEMLLANAMGESGGGGGGGGDLSVAEVTITLNTTITLIAVAYINTGYNDSEGEYFPSEGTNTIQVILYKGTAFASIVADHAISVTTTGDVEYTDGELIITGNGTITIS